MIAAHPGLAQTLADHGLTLDPVIGEVVELQPFNQVMSKRSAQINRNLDRLEAEWEAAHPGEEPGPVMTARMQGIAWAHQRPGKKPADLKNEQWWRQELCEAGYDLAVLERKPVQPPASLDDLAVQEVASRALDRCAAGASAWTPHTVAEHVTRITTEAGVRATPQELREFIAVATDLATGDCLSILPPGAPTPEHVAHLTSLGVVAAETELRDQLTAATPRGEPKPADVTEAARTAGLDEGQTVAAAAVASRDPLVIVEGAAGAGKTTMLGVAIGVAAEHGRPSRVVAPTLRAAQVAHDELGVPATSVAALVYAHGWRWNADGVWTRLAAGDTDPETGRIYTGPPREAVLRRGERVIVDEAGMLDQDTARALITVTAEAKVTVALVGDRAQLPAVGRGGVLDMAAQIRGRTYDMSELHRFTDPEYAALTLTMRDRENPGDVFDQLAAMGLIHLHADDDAARDHITEHTRDGEAITVATNDEAAALNERIRNGRVEAGEVDDAVTATGSDGLTIGAGDLIQTRKNDTTLGVANRQQWIVQQVAENGTVYARETASGRRNPRTVTLPAEYVEEHAHLSYAATAYGVQGATVNTSHTILSEATTAAGVYVGMTRGRETNRLHVVAEDMADARVQFIDAMERDPADRGLDHATRTAQEAVRGLMQTAPFGSSPKNSPGSTVKPNAHNARRNDGSRSPPGSMLNAPPTEPKTTRASPRSARPRKPPSRHVPRSPGRSPPRPSTMVPPTSVPSRTRPPNALVSPPWGGSAGAEPGTITRPRRIARGRCAVKSAASGARPRPALIASLWAVKVAAKRAETDPRVTMLCRPSTPQPPTMRRCGSVMSRNT